MQASWGSSRRFHVSRQEAGPLTSVSTPADSAGLDLSSAASFLFVPLFCWFCSLGIDCRWKQPPGARPGLSGRPHQYFVYPCAFLTRAEGEVQGVRKWKQ